jgi:DNA gyrase subunit A
MATNIPPHNLREILNACTALVQARMDPSSLPVSDEHLCQMVPGPDFPTGASIMGTSGAKQLYSTGNGGIVLRAITEMEQVSRGGSSGQSRTAIIVKELPYQVNKAALLEKVAELVNDKKLEGIADLRDESDRDGIRVVLELKKDAIPAVVLANLYKKTTLQTSFSGNFLALFGGNEDENTNDMNDNNGSSLTPKRFTLREALDCFLDFRFTTLRRKAAFQLGKVEARMHIVQGLLLALSKLDAIIDLIRTSPDQASVKKALMDPKGLLLGLSQGQADALLKLQLGQLTRLSQGKLTEEQGDLETQQRELNRLLTQERAVYEVMLQDFIELDEKFGVDRKTQILNDDGDVSEIEMIKNSRSGKWRLC